MLTNLVKPTSGEIEMFGENLTNTSYEVLKRLGSIIEYPIFYEKLTARENLDLHCEYMGYHNKKSIDNALDLVNLRNIDSKPVKDFSLGMKQRLGIARAITTKPELLILDEPINGLDPLGISELRNLFIMLSKEYGITILLSSHILGEIEKIADTVGVIKDGTLIKEVTMDSIRESNTEYIEVTVNDPKKAAYILSNTLSITNFKIADSNTIRIYEMHATQNVITKEFVTRDVTIESISKKRSSLEDYFLTILNGGCINA
jgi:ABC-2 type transport system ATP-binding protein